MQKCSMKSTTTTATTTTKQVEVECLMTYFAEGGVVREIQDVDFDDRIENTDEGFFFTQRHCPVTLTGPNSLYPVLQSSLVASASDSPASAVASQNEWTLENVVSNSE